MRGVLGIAVAAAVGLTLPIGAGADPGSPHARAVRTAASAAAVFPGALTDSVPAPAEAGATFDDPGRDVQSGLAPDVTRTTIRNDAAGIITFDVEIANVPEIRGRDFFALFLDVDRDTTSGSPTSDGADYAIAIRGSNGTVGLARWHNGAWDFETPQASLDASWSSGPTIRIDRAEVGGTAAFRFWIGASWTDTAGRATTDFAPDSGTWEYVLPGLEALPGPPPDVSAPTAKALRTTGRAGGHVGIRYRLRDDSGSTWERVRVFRPNGRLLWSFETELAPSQAGRVYWVPWEAPRGVGLKLRFCVRAWDEAGNVSKPSCAALRLKRHR